jgi:hypothetical protein
MMRPYILFHWFNPGIRQGLSPKRVSMAPESPRLPRAYFFTTEAPALAQSFRFLHCRCNPLSKVKYKCN